VKAGSHVDLVGGFRPDMREADDALMAAASLFVDTYAGACKEAGDIVQPQQAGLLTSASVLAELAELVSAKHGGRNNAEEITVFKSVGTALEDLCAANLVWQRLGQTASK
jgi:ornithine cyclodeaminase